MRRETKEKGIYESVFGMLGTISNSPDRQSIAHSTHYKMPDSFIQFQTLKMEKRKSYMGGKACCYLKRIVCLLCNPCGFMTTARFPPFAAKCSQKEDYNANTSYIERMALQICCLYIKISEDKRNAPKSHATCHCRGI